MLRGSTTWIGTFDRVTGLIARFVWCSTVIKDVCLEPNYTFMIGFVGFGGALADKEAMDLFLVLCTIENLNIFYVNI